MKLPQVVLAVCLTALCFVPLPVQADEPSVFVLESGFKVADVHAATEPMLVGRFGSGETKVQVECHGDPVQCQFRTPAGKTLQFDPSLTTKLLAKIKQGLNTGKSVTLGITARVCCFTETMVCVGTETDCSFCRGQCG
jgi:hypothetical protein